jgi:hypothetical protein
MQTFPHMPQLFESIVGSMHAPLQMAIGGMQGPMESGSPPSGGFASVGPPSGGTTTHMFTLDAQSDPPHVPSVDPPLDPLMHNCVAPQNPQPDWRIHDMQSEFALHGRMVPSAGLLPSRKVKSCVHAVSVAAVITAHDVRRALRNHDDSVANPCRPRVGMSAEMLLQSACERQRNARRRRGIRARNPLSDRRDVASIERSPRVGVQPVLEAEPFDRVDVSVAPVARRAVEAPIGAPRWHRLRASL